MSHTPPPPPPLPWSMSFLGIQIGHNTVILSGGEAEKWQEHSSSVGKLSVGQSRGGREAKYTLSPSPQPVYSPDSLTKPCLCMFPPTNILTQGLTPPLGPVPMAGLLLQQWLVLLASLGSHWTKGLYIPRSPPFHFPMSLGRLLGSAVSQGHP